MVAGRPQNSMDRSELNIINYSVYASRCVDSTSTFIHIYLCKVFVPFSLVERVYLCARAIYLAIRTAYE